MVEYNGGLCLIFLYFVNFIQFYHTKISSITESSNNFLFFFISITSQNKKNYHLKKYIIKLKF